MTFRVPHTALATIAVALLILTGCSAPAAESAPVPSQGTAADAATMLAPLGISATDGRTVADALEAMPVAERPSNFFASVRPSEVQLTDAAGNEASLPLPDDVFYVSVAPYATQTHDCFFHSLTTCRGELANAAMQVKIVNKADGSTVIDETRTARDNGFVGFWLPRDIDATITITQDGRTVTGELSTHEDSPTCVTTFQLS